MKSILLVCACLLLPLTSLGQTPDGETAAATVAGVSISVADIRRLINTTYGESPIAPEALPGIQAEALEQLINRRLVALNLDRRKFTVSEADIDAAVKTFEAQAAGRAIGLDQLLAERGLTKAAMREQLAWEVRWNKYVRQQVTEKELEAYFAAHRRDFDGTEIRVSHILLRPTGTLDQAAYDALTKQAAQLRSEFVGGKLSFAEAAKKHSAGPSRTRGGDLGYIPRRDRMVEAFSRAAFALAKDEISPPVATAFGVHLIQCTEIKPGKNTWQDTREELFTAASQDLFLKLAGEIRPTTPIAFSGAMPYIDPKTRQVVAPKSR